MSNLTIKTTFAYENGTKKKTHLHYFDIHTKILHYIKNKNKKIIDDEVNYEIQELKKKK